MADVLDEFLAKLREGTTVREFLDDRAKVLEFVRSGTLLSDYRLGRGRAKRLRDEIEPAARFAAEQCAADDRIQFPLDNGASDCNVWHGGRHRTLQITVAQALERLFLMSELNESGSSRGIIGLGDDYQITAFRKHRERGAAMYATAEAQDSVVSAFALCIRKKSKKSGAHTLLVDAPVKIETLPLERWQEIVPRLAAAASASPFAEVFVVGDFCLRVK